VGAVVVVVGVVVVVVGIVGLVVVVPAQCEKKAKVTQQKLHRMHCTQLLTAKSKNFQVQQIPKIKQLHKIGEVRK